MDGVTLSKIAHELRTPLTLINSTLQMIESQLPQMKEFKYWIRLNEDFNDMTDLVSSLTTFQCAGNEYPEETDLFHMLEGLREGFLLDQLGQGACLDLNATQEAGQAARHFHCNRIQMKEVFTNLIKNALEASLSQKERLISVTLSTRHLHMPDGQNDIHFLCAAIRDNGPGIPQELLPRLFTPFASGHNNGTGLGLYIVHNIVTAHNGYLDVETGASGSTFFVYLPYIL